MRERDRREMIAVMAELAAHNEALLEAAKEALAAIELQCSKCDKWCDGECFDSSCTVHEAAARIDAAVAKAQGREAP